MICQKSAIRHREVKIDDIITIQISHYRLTSLKITASFTSLEYFISHSGMRRPATLFHQTIPRACLLLFFASALMARGVGINISLIFLRDSWKSARLSVLRFIDAVPCRVRRMFFSRLDEYEREEISRLILGDWSGRW